MARPSIRSHLLAWLLVPLAASVAINTWITYLSAVRSATEVQERLLLGSARIIAQQVRIDDGVLQVVIPPAALELFRSERTRDRVYYRLASPDGELLSGYAELPPPAARPEPEEWAYFMATMRGQAVRVVAYSQPVVGVEAAGPVLIEVAQTLDGHTATVTDIYLRELVQQGLLLALVGVLGWFALRRGLAPLDRLSRQVAAREPASSLPLEAANLPRELRPLVGSLNEYVARLRRYQVDRERFIANAAHQLRTPLTILQTQVSVALRTPEPRVREEALHAIERGIRNGRRLVNQLMNLAAAETAERVADDPIVELSSVVVEVLEEVASFAETRGVDIGIEAADGPYEVKGVRRMIHELVANLVDNAIRYGRSGGSVTARLAKDDGWIVLAVVDDGPGIAPADRARVFERFVRLDDRSADGSGLGLAIVREIAQGAGATVALGARADGPGLEVTVRFPAAVPATATPGIDAPGRA